MAQRPNLCSAGGSSGNVGPGRAGNCTALVLAHVAAAAGRRRRRGDNGRMDGVGGQLGTELNRAMGMTGTEERNDLKCDMPTRREIEREGERGEVT